MVSTVKLLTLAALGFTALVLGMAVISLSVILEQRKSLAQNRKPTKVSVTTSSSTSNGKTTSADNDAEDGSGSKTSHPSRPMDPRTELNIRQTSYAPSDTDARISADAHLGEALRLMPYEAGGGDESGNAIPPRILHSDYRQGGRGFDFVMHRKERKAAREARKSDRRSRMLDIVDGSGDNRAGGVGGVGAGRRLALRFLEWVKTIDSGDRLDSFLTKLALDRGLVDDPSDSGADDSYTQRGHRDADAVSALRHLERASEMGNSHAQYMVGSALASGILPVGNSARYSSNATALTVSADFAEGGAQLASALTLWHAAAMDGHVEAAMALGYRHRYSALGGRDDNGATFITDAGLAAADESDGESGDRHTSPKAHYGLLGTCESSLAYYEAAANGIMDELESSELRGKVNPAIDQHRLAEIHAHGGASSTLAHHNKPDELDEAIQYYRMRAARNHLPEPDVHAAYTLANFYHYGMRGVRQDMKLALKYYEIAADSGSWEAAGQAGKFHFWGLGLDEEERDLRMAYKYFQMGTPGGVEGCQRRWKESRDKAKRKKKKRHDPERDDYDELDEDYDEEDSVQCDHPCLNGMGLLSLFGIPNLVPVNVGLAQKYFQLSRDLGNADANYNLGMMRLGWMVNEYVDENHDNYDGDHEEWWYDYDEGNDWIGEYGPDFLAHVRAKKLNVFNRMLHRLEVEQDKIDVAERKAIEAGGKSTKYDGPTKSEYQIAMNELNAASNKGHIQAKHRLGMMYARGVELKNYKGSGQDIMVVPKDCARALNHFRSVAMQGTTVSRRTRAAYKQYVAGDPDSSLRNYLAAAETGSEIGQINAAFLLERGHCLGLNEEDCARASVRLWRAAARQGNAEACLRVGDFYYYGRMRKRSSPRKLAVEDSTSKHRIERRDGRGDYYALGPYKWTRYLLYPEELLPIVKLHLVRAVRQVLAGGRDRSETSTSTAKIPPPTCPLDRGSGSDGTCPAKQEDEVSSPESDDLATAAQYYRMAAENHKSARANFNLGYMHEWGLGLTQDFPLAKRHYDLAAASNAGEAKIAVDIALASMGVHERMVKARLEWEEYWETHDWDKWVAGLWRFRFVPPVRKEVEEMGTDDAAEGESALSPSMTARDAAGTPKGSDMDNQKGHPVPGQRLHEEDDDEIDARKRKVKLIISHVLRWDSLFVAMLMFIIWSLVQERRREQQRRRRRGVMAGRPT